MSALGHHGPFKVFVRHRPWGDYSVAVYDRVQPADRAELAARIHVSEALGD